MDIRVHIERLILDGLPITHSQGALVQAAVETELARLLTEGGIASSLQSGGALPGVRAGAMQQTSNAGPTQLGQQIARAVYQGIGTGETGGKATP
jgi:hypothetical protein